MCSTIRISKDGTNPVKKRAKTVDILEELLQLVQMPIDKDTQLLHKSSETALIRQRTSTLTH